jgi:membrane-associated protease RseP (regulator of RpoE activity)
MMRFSGLAFRLAFSFVGLSAISFSAGSHASWARGKGGTSGIDWHCTPSFGEQKLMGMKCTGIKPASILHKAGIKDGDIVTSVDGKPTLSPRDMMNSVRDLKEADRASIKVIRDGKERTLSYVK